MAIVMAVAVLALHIVPLLTLPPDQAEPFAYMATGLGTFGSALAAALFVFKTSGSTRYRWALVAVAMCGRGINYFNAADSELHRYTPRSVGFWSLAIAFACFLVALTAVYVAGSRLLRFLDVLLVLFLCVLRYVVLWGGGGGIYANNRVSYYNLFLFSYLFLLVAAGIAALAAMDADEFRFAMLMLLYFGLQCISGLCGNQLSHLWLHQDISSPWFVVCTVIEIVFVFAALLTLGGRQAADYHRLPNMVARGTMPVFLALATVGMGVILLSAYHALGLTAIGLGVACYVFRTVYMQRYYVLAQKDLLTRNTHLEDLLDRDTLTGIGNRRSLAPAIDRHCNEAAITGQSVYLLLLDIDGFKEANDALGHLYGDRCLLSIANTLARELRPTQHHLARYGGDEFTVVLRSPDLQYALRTAEFLRMAVMELQLGAPGSPLTLSIGVAAATLPAAAIGHLLETADRALYRAKKRGRNCVEFEPESVQPPSSDLMLQ